MILSYKVSWIKPKMGKPLGYLTEEGMLKTSNGRTVVPNDTELRRDILDEAR
jgi:hypothetical protein